MEEEEGERGPGRGEVEGRTQVEGLMSVIGCHVM